MSAGPERAVVTCCCAALVLLVGCGGRRAAPDVARPVTLGSLEITSDPPGAGVLEGERRLGATPLVVERPAGTRLQLQIVKDGFVPHRLAALVPDRARMRLHAALRRGKASVIVRAGPLRGGRILVDGKHVATLPERVDLEEGKHEIEVTKQGFQPYRETVRVKAGETLEVDALLVPEGRRVPPTGWLFLRAEGQNDRPLLVYVDGSLLGMTPLRRLRLPARSHKLEIRRGPNDRAIKTTQFTIKVGETTEIILPSR